MDKKKIAVVILAYADYESLEVSLAAHMKFSEPGVKYYILQNGRGTYDTEKTYRVAKRYHYLFPKQIEVVDWIKPQPPYLSIQELLNTPEMAQYDYICKTDDDVFPLTKGWLEELYKCYQKYLKKYGDELGYVSALVNNHFYGFPRVLDYLGLKEEYFSKIARDHIVGVQGNEYYPLQVLSKNEFYEGGAGTIEHYPSILKWLHKNTTLKPDNFISKTSNKTESEFNPIQRFSIHCTLFKRTFWNEINIGSTDDEHQYHMFCMKNKKHIIVDEKVPFIHLMYNWQREGIRDMMPEIKKFYEKWLNLNYPISICSDKNYEIEDRLRWIENILTSKKKPSKKNFYLFGFLPILTKITKNHKVYYKLFNKITVLKTKEN